MARKQERSVHYAGGGGDGGVEGDDGAVGEAGTFAKRGRCCEKRVLSVGGFVAGAKVAEGECFGGKGHIQAADVRVRRAASVRMRVVRSVACSCWVGEREDCS